MVVPEAVRRKAIAEGAACTRWLADLGPLITQLERDWDLTVGATLDGGTAALVAEAVRDDGTAAVIKLAMPAVLDGRDALENEVRTLLLADGRRCVRVLEYDAERGAVLLERLGRQLAQLELPVSTQMEIICSALEEVWAVPYEEGQLPLLDEKGRWLAEFIAGTWEELDHPCSLPVVERAVAYAERRSAAFDPDRAVLAHGDAHAWNTLEDPAGAGHGGFKLIDPDGLIAEPEYDLAILMREFNDGLVAGDASRIGPERARFLARLSGLDEQRIWEWGYVE
ncbi:MAG: streptomycin 6-kinase, partial [Actinomycetota bacterium]|nr:streptomycin 6-kinase [Actinomycetota bacterium]